MKKVLVLGCTGSIGKNTLQIIRNMGEMFQVCGLVAHKNAEQLATFTNEFGCKGILTEKDGIEAIRDLIAETKPDIAVNGISGSAGLLPSKIVLEAGVDLALANKETVVMAWALIKKLAKKNKCNVIPVDSEHSAIFNLINQVKLSNIDKIVITASGGPFRTYSSTQLQTVTIEDALKHPTWRMGKKITIDSATLANKGLEVIEATKLFEVPTDKIEVVVHPQSLIHSLVQTNDGVLYAQISDPDMKRPIFAALTYPNVEKNYLEPFNLFDKTMTFFKPRLNDFPMLSYAFEVAKKEKSYTIAYNAANEVAVEAFLENKIDFTTISRVVRSVLDKDWTMEVKNFDDVFAQDKKAREYTLAAL